MLGRPHGGSGERRHEGSHQPARTWGEVRRWWWQVRTPALVTLGVAGAFSALDTASVPERLRGGERGTGRRRSGPGSKQLSGGPERPGEPAGRLFRAELRPGVMGG